MEGSVPARFLLVNLRAKKKGRMMHSKAKQKAVAARIKGLEASIIKGREYLESGKHANWRGFRPLFYGKVRNGKELPPHKDWVRNVFIPRRERALRYAEKLLERFES
jgi:hypothetical protein